MKIKILKDYSGGKIGEIKEASFPAGDEQEYVDNGFIKILDDKIPKKRVKKILKKNKKKPVKKKKKPTKKDGEIKILKEQEAELYKWVGIIERYPQIYSGEINDIPLIPKYLLIKLADKFDFIQKYIDEHPSLDEYDQDDDGNKKLTKQSTKHILEILVDYDEIDREEELEKLSNISKIKITTLRNQLNELLKVKRKKDKLEKIEETPKTGSAYQIFTIEGQVQEFYRLQPFFYSKAGMFVIWNNELKKYEISDDVDMLNGISRIGADTISSKTKTEIITALKQYGRRRIPIDAPVTWVQFKDKIYDYKTEETFDASPKYFITNPIPFNMGESEDTPTIDKLLIEWVGEEYHKTAEEIIAYSASSDQFMQRLIALVGGGSNGKGTYLKLLIKFLGEDNTTSSELKELSSNQFETAVIYKKLLCIMGEVSYDDLQNTNQLKKLAGEDPIRYCFKGKTPFTEKSSTTLINATNSLPKTPDKTTGFYRKWLIVDFPNQFTEIKHGIIENIPKIEFENLAKKVFRILGELYKKQKFTNEGNFEERMRRYEERSNPVVRFVESNCEEVVGNYIELRLFSNNFNEYAKNNHLRILSVRQISKILRDEGFEMGKRAYNINGDNKTSRQVILNLEMKNTRNTENTETSSQSIHGELTSTSGISGISGISQDNEEIGEDKINEHQEQLDQMLRDAEQ